MAKMLSLIALIFLFATSPAFAHHPAADMVDADVYEMIEALVDDTPHADMEFDDMGGETLTTISIDSVSAADDLISDGLLDGVSLLEGEVRITIEFPEELEALTREIQESAQGNPQGDYYYKKWVEWGRPVEIKILQISK